MAILKVQLCNSGGVLDERLVFSSDDADVEAGACRAAIKMLEEAGSLSAGDVLLITTEGKD